MVKSQVFSDDRPSNEPSPRSAASQVSWTTSSATARLGTNDSASRSMAPLCRSTRSTNAPSSPARSRRSSSPSESIVGSVSPSDWGGRGSPITDSPQPPQSSVLIPAQTATQPAVMPSPPTAPATVTEPIEVSAPPAPTAYSSTMPDSPVCT